MLTTVIRRILYFVILVGCGCQVLADTSASKPTNRVALVIGNANYERRPLKNPRNDADDISAALRRSNFDVIDVRDATLAQMRSAVREFGDRLLRNDVGLVYYSGHGLEVKGKNYFLPINADIQRSDEVVDQSLDVSLILEKMATARKAVNILIIDACRVNSDGKSFFDSKGLAAMDAPKGTIIAFATSPGQEASDGNGRNSPYTKALVKAMQKPDRPIEQLFKEVRRVVQEETNNKQTPWENTSLSGEFCFGQCVADPTAVNDERALWDSVKDSKNIPDLRAYLNRFPNGLFAELASNRIRVLQAKNGDQENAVRMEQERLQREAAEALAKREQEERLAAETRKSEEERLRAELVKRTEQDRAKSDSALAMRERIVYFDFDSFAIREDAVPILEAHARRLRADVGLRVALEGHTDERGGREYNVALGQKRTDAVREALILLGVSDSQMEAVSFGKEKPAVPGTSEAAMQENRRVEINYR
jgi:peptidoglycan-associated lipoprotein